MAARHPIRIESGAVVGNDSSTGGPATRRTASEREFACWATLPSHSGYPVERDVDVRVETNRIQARAVTSSAPALEGVEQMGDELREVDVGQLIGPELEEQGAHLRQRATIELPQTVGAMNSSESGSMSFSSDSAVSAAVHNV